MSASEPVEWMSVSSLVSPKRRLGSLFAHKTMDFLLVLQLEMVLMLYELNSPWRLSIVLTKLLVPDYQLELS